MQLLYQKMTELELEGIRDNVLNELVRRKEGVNDYTKVLGVIECKKDGNMYCWLYGEDLQVGISGFGETKKEALIEFCQKYLEQFGYLID